MYATNVPKVFAAGDMARGQSRVDLVDLMNPEPLPPFPVGAQQHHAPAGRRDRRGQAVLMSTQSTLSTAPPFQLPTQKGELRSLADFLAKGPVLLAFHRGTW